MKKLLTILAVALFATTLWAQDTTPAPDPIIPEALSFNLSYTMMNDYVFRGVNMSDRPGGNEPFQQLKVEIGYDLSEYGDYGEVGVTTAYNWFGGDNAEYSMWWKKSFDAYHTDAKVALTYWDWDIEDMLSTWEMSLQLDHNDAWIWEKFVPGIVGKEGEGVLNPSVLVVYDFDEQGGVWSEFGLSHPFDMADYGVPNLVLTPGTSLGIDSCYWGDGVQLANIVWKLDAAYDLSTALSLPTEYGSISIVGEIKYQTALNTFDKDGFGDDEFWGGVSFVWGFGG